MIFKPELIEKILAGEKTMTRRPVNGIVFACRYKPGRTYAVQPGRGKKGVARIRVTDVRRERWNDISRADAISEGFGAFKLPIMAFLDYVWELYPDLNPEAEVWVITFELVEGSDQ